MAIRAADFQPAAARIGRMERTGFGLFLTIPHSLQVGAGRRIIHAGSIVARYRSYAGRLGRQDRDAAASHIVALWQAARSMLSAACSPTARLPIKKAAANRPWASTAAFYKSNFRLIATMRSRSKKGEVGLCCAQPCDRPEPIVIMVLPTEYQPESLICSRGPTRRAGRRRVLYRPLAAAAGVDSKTAAAGARRYTIILVCGSRFATFFAPTLIDPSVEQTPCRTFARRCMQTVYRARFGVLNALVPSCAFLYNRDAFRSSLSQLSSTFVRS